MEEVMKENSDWLVDVMDKSEGMMKSINDKLKPCPFCGGKVEITDICLDVGIVCEKCNLKLVQGTVKRAINAWNRRAK